MLTLSRFVETNEVTAQAIEMITSPITELIIIDRPPETALGFPWLIMILNPPIAMRIIESKNAKGKINTSIAAVINDPTSYTLPDLLYPIGLATLTSPRVSAICLSWSVIF